MPPGRISFVGCSFAIDLVVTNIVCLARQTGAGGAARENLNLCIMIEGLRSRVPGQVFSAATCFSGLRGYVGAYAIMEVHGERSLRP